MWVQWRRSCLMALAVCLVLLTILCSVTFVGLQTDRIQPPATFVDVGSVWIGIPCHPMMEFGLWYGCASPYTIEVIDKRTGLVRASVTIPRLR
jgi:hypothetical protein